MHCPACACALAVEHVTLAPCPPPPPLPQGQRLVSPTAAQITFCSVPIWSALLAAALLPGEAVSRGTLLGGAVVAAAGLVAALPLGAAPAPPDRPKQQ